MDDPAESRGEKSPNVDEECDISSFSHKDLIEITKTTLNEVVERDSLLSDLPRDVTLEEVNAQIALEHGQSMTVFVERADGEELPVVDLVYPVHRLSLLEHGPRYAALHLYNALPRHLKETPTSFAFKKGLKVKHKDATVLDLKRAIRRHMAWKMDRLQNKVKISWRYIWKTYYLVYDSERLTKDEKLLSEIGIRNKARVTFVKRLRGKGGVIQEN